MILFFQLQSRSKLRIQLVVADTLSRPFDKRIVELSLQMNYAHYNLFKKCFASNKIWIIIVKATAKETLHKAVKSGIG